MIIFPFLAVIFFLILFGLGYNWFITWLEDVKRVEGWSWLYVVIGVTVTVTTSAFLIGKDNALIVFICFAASGLFMALGALSRHNKKEKLFEKQAKEYGTQKRPKAD